MFEEGWRRNPELLHRWVLGEGMTEATVDDIFREQSIEAMPGVSKRCRLRVVER